MDIVPVTDLALVADIRQLIDGARQRAATAVNAELTLLYWQVGTRIHAEVLEKKRADYGQEIVSTLSRQLEVEYGRGWGEKQLRHCLRAAQTFPDEQIVYALRRQLSWTHIRALMYIDNPLKRDFYIELCRLERWSSRQLQERISSMLFERTAISKKPDATIQHDLDVLRKEQRPSPDLLLKDPYVLDVLGLNDRYLKKDLEDAILREIEHFMLELGAGFTFVARQKRLQIDTTDFYIDLLFYNRKLKRLVVIDLKVGEFRAEYKGQMELYLRWLVKHEQEPGQGDCMNMVEKRSTLSCSPPPPPLRGRTTRLDFCTSQKSICRVRWGVLSINESGAIPPSPALPLKGGGREKHESWTNPFMRLPCEPGENPPLGIILCAGRAQEQIELLELDKSGIHVAEYLTVRPPRDVLRAKLHQATEAARRRLLGDRISE